MRVKAYSQPNTEIMAAALMSVLYLASTTNAFGAPQTFKCQISLEKGRYPDVPYVELKLESKAFSTTMNLEDIGSPDGNWQACWYGPNNNFGTCPGSPAKDFYQYVTKEHPEYVSYNFDGYATCGSSAQEDAEARQPQPANTAGQWIFVEVDWPAGGTYPEKTKKNKKCERYDPITKRMHNMC